MKNGQYVVVTTDSSRRGVFAGILEHWDQESAVAILVNARMAVYWNADTHGVLGLASIGPQDGSRITPPVPRLQIDGVTAVMETTQQARDEWEKEKWS